MIHCVKAGQMAVSAVAAVSGKNAKLVTESDEHTIDFNSDLFASEVEEDEAIIDDN